MNKIRATNSTPLSAGQLQRVVLGSILLPGLLFLLVAALVMSLTYGVLHQDRAIVRSDRILASCYRAELACAASNTTDLSRELQPRLQELVQLTEGDEEQQIHVREMLSMLASAPQTAERMLFGLQAIAASAQSRRVEEAMALQRKIVTLLLGCAFVAVVPMALILWWERRHLHRVVTSYARIMGGLQAAVKRNRDLAKGLQTAQEQERGRIARELHDDLGQIFTSHKMDLRWLSKQPGLDAPVAERIDEMLKLNAAAVTSVRRIVNELRPAILDDLGLLEALDWLLRETAARSGIAVRTRWPAQVALAAELESALFRMVQEGLTNIRKHASATELTLQLKVEPQQIWLRLCDNGKGIEKSPSSLLSSGQLGVRERAELLGGWAGYRNRPHGRGAVLLAILPREAS